MPSYDYVFKKNKQTIEWAATAAVKEPTARNIAKSRKHNIVRARVSRKRQQHQW